MTARSSQVRYESHTVQFNLPTISIIRLVLLHTHQLQVLSDNLSPGQLWASSMVPALDLHNHSCHPIITFPSFLHMSKPPRFTQFYSILNICSTGMPSFQQCILRIILFSLFSNFLRFSRAMIHVLLPYNRRFLIHVVYSHPYLFLHNRVAIVLHFLMPYPLHLSLLDLTRIPLPHFT